MKNIVEIKKENKNVNYSQKMLGKYYKLLDNYNKRIEENDMLPTTPNNKKQTYKKMNKDIESDAHEKRNTFNKRKIINLH